MQILTPMYKEIGCCVMSDGCQNTNNRPILNVMETVDGHVNVRRVFDTSRQESVHGLVPVGHQTHLHKPDGQHGNGNMTTEKVLLTLQKI